MNSAPVVPLSDTRLYKRLGNYFRPTDASQFIPVSRHAAAAAVKIIHDCAHLCATSQLHGFSG